MKTVTLYNDFHGTSVRVRTGDLSKETARRVRRELCGISGCTCGGFLGERGNQRGVLVEPRNGDFDVRVSIE